MNRVMIVLLMVVLVIGSVDAQTDEACPALVRNAMVLTDEFCATTGRNEMCYGNEFLTVSMRDAGTSVAFKAPGDKINIDAVSNMQLSVMDVDGGTWGIALMKVQANLASNLPGQNATVVMFGDVLIEQLDLSVPTTIMVATTDKLRVRDRPTTNDSYPLTTLAIGEMVTATGKLSDGSWIRVTLDDGIYGWVSGEFLEGDDAVLEIVAEDDAVAYGPMQAFTFSSGVGDNACLEAPSSGLLIQTPKGAGKVLFLVNGVEILLGSTVYLQAQPDDYLYVYVLEGQATLTVEGVSQVVPAGTVSQVELDATGLASAAPEFPQPYTRLTVRSVPMHLLPEAVGIARPLSDNQIQASISGITPVSTTSSGTLTTTQGSTASLPSDGLPPSGRWTNTWTLIANTCDPATSAPVGASGTSNIYMTFSDDRSSVVGPEGRTYYRQSDFYYVNLDADGQRVRAMTFTSQTSYFLTDRGDYTFTPCIFYQDESGYYLGP